MPELGREDVREAFEHTHRIVYGVVGDSVVVLTAFDKRCAAVMIPSRDQASELGREVRGFRLSRTPKKETPRLLSTRGYA